MRLNPGSIAWRITTVIATLCIALIAVAVWQSAVIRHRLLELRHEGMQQAERHLAGLVELESQPIRTFVASYSWWDELVNAVERSDRAWLSANIDPATRDYQLHAILVLNRDGSVIHSTQMPPAQVDALLRTVDLAALARHRQVWTHAVIDGVVMDIAGSTIHPTADTARTTEPRGYLIGVRGWMHERALGLARHFGGRVDVATALPAAVDGMNGTVAVNHPLLDASGRDVAWLLADRQVPAFIAIASQSKAYLVISVVFAICALLALGAMGLLIIGKPLNALAFAAQQHDLRLALSLAGRRDELGAVAQAVARSIEQQEHLTIEIAQRRQAEDRQREANTRLTADLRRREETEQALRDAEMRNALALQGGNLCLWEFFLEGGRWSTDRGWLSFLGVTLDPAAPDSAAWESRLDQDGLAQINERIALIRSGSAETIESTFRLQRDDGGFIWLLMRGMVVERGGDGQPNRLSGTMLDVTKWRELEEQLRQSQKLESIGQMAAGIAHEINTPIQFIGDNTRFAAEIFTTLISFAKDQAELASSHPDPAVRERVVAATTATDFPYLEAEVPKAMEQTLEGVTRVATIVRAMKEFSHPGSSELTLSDLNHQIENAVVISRSTWKYVADLTTEFDHALPLVPLAAGDFNQVLLNLIVNAAQAIEDAQRKLGKPAPGRIVISTSHDNDWAILRISDDGCGIPEEIRERIYDPFFTTKEVGRGSGQGLTITHTVVIERHHGRLACESTVGVGTTFIVSLPLKPPKG